MILKLCLVSALLSSAIAFASDRLVVLANCQTQNNQSFKLSYQETMYGKILVNDKETALYHVSNVGSEGDAGDHGTFVVEAGNGSLITLSWEGSNLVSYADRAAIGGPCVAEKSSIDKNALIKLAEHATKLRQSSWDLMSCIVDGNVKSVFKLEFTRGFGPETANIKGYYEGDGDYSAYLAFVAADAQSHSRLGQPSTKVLGDGALHIFGAGHHVRAIPGISFNAVNADLPANEWKVVTGIEAADSGLSQCKVSNLWKLKELLAH